MQEVLENYRFLMKATSNAVFDYDLLSNYTQWNENIRLFGYKPDEVEPSLEWWSNRVHPDDRATALGSLNSDEGLFEDTYRFRCADGNYRQVIAKGCVLKNAEGLPANWIVALQDVHFYSQIFDQSPQPMWIFLRGSLQRLAVNEAAIRLYGYSKEDFLSKNIGDTCPPEEAPLFRTAMGSPDPEREASTVWRHFNQAGKLIHVEVRTQDLDFFGQPARIAFVTDVSRHIVQLAGGIAHEFNNVLTIILGYSQQLLASEYPDRADIEAVEVAATRAVALSQQLLALSTQQPANPKNLIWAEVLTTLEPQLRSLLTPGIELHVVSETNQAPTKLDLSQCEQILSSLVSNARVAISAEGKITVTSTLVEMNPNHPDYRQGASPGTCIQLIVADTGNGLSVSSLSSVNSIVQQANGWTCVDSDPGIGTTIRVYLPAIQTPAMQSQARILVVDDESDLRRLIAGSLMAQGFQVVEAANGNEALTALETQPIHLILTDLVMPDREGLETIQTVGKRFPQIPIIAISGAFEGQFLLLAKALGAKAILRKPLDMAELIAETRRLLG